MAELHTIQWVNDAGELVELDVPVADLERFARGERIDGPWPERRYTGREALDRLREQMAGYRARNDQIRARLDQMVDRSPALKSLRPRDG